MGNYKRLADTYHSCKVKGMFKKLQENIKRILLNIDPEVANIIEGADELTDCRSTLDNIFLSIEDDEKHGEDAPLLSPINNKVSSFIVGSETTFVGKPKMYIEKDHVLVWRRFARELTSSFTNRKVFNFS